MKAARLTTLPLDQLLAIRDRINTIIAKLVAKERERIQAELAALGGDRPWRGRPPKSNGNERKQKRAKAPIKYRGPKRGEKWSGRGMMPLWMRAYIKAGKKKESFLVK